MQQYLPLPEMVVIADLPSVQLTDRTQLPSEPGIYFVLDKEQILYIGRTQSLRTRWATHHRLGMYLSRPGISVSWLTVSNKALLPSIERACVEYFGPVDNGQRYDYGNEDINRRRCYKYMPKDTSKHVQMIIRVPVDICEWVERKAKADGHSINRVVLQILLAAKALDEQLLIAKSVAP